MIKDKGAIDLSVPPGHTRTVRTANTIKKVKQRVVRKKRASERQIAWELAISESSDRRILHEDLRRTSHYRSSEWQANAIRESGEEQFLDD